MGGKHKEHHEEHADETWLVPYSDLLTLLLALFVVLFAISQVDQHKLQQMNAAFNISFSGGSSIMFDRDRMVESPPNAAQKPSPQIQLQNMPNVPMPKFNVLPVASVVDEQAYLKETAELIEIKRLMDEFIESNGLEAQLTTVLTDEGLMIRIKETALFPSGSAYLTLESRKLAEQIAKMLAQISQEVAVSGHTDTDPISTREFPSNWELSGMRALNFMKLILNQEKKLAPARFRAIGYGEYRPVVPNDTEENKSTNRRVEVFIQRNYRI